MLTVVAGAAEMLLTTTKGCFRSTAGLVLASCSQHGMDEETG